MIPKTGRTKGTKLPDGIDMLARQLAAGGLSGYHLVLAADLIDSSGTPVSAPGMVMPVEAGKTYRVDFLGGFTTAAVNTGAVINLTAIDSAAGTLYGVARSSVDVDNVPIVIPQTTRTVVELAQPLPALPATVTFEGAAGTGYIQMEYIFVCTASGNLDLRWATEVAASAATLKAGAILEVKTVR